ncbi:transposase (plasmid) [Roseomonas marmotae]|uniref:Transposase n=1 Tax=Roseomonas marmotae TaxID=2768161 RepID=A0ABS3KI76_9PROT|nr:transposase [Roseomonas marmotae]QTI81229.1 transposase [Roseomonas marmotae]
MDRLSQGSKLAGDIRYGLRYWGGFVRFLEDRRLEMDTNTVERQIRPWPSPARQRCSRAARQVARTGPSRR